MPSSDLPRISDWISGPMDEADLAPDQIAVGINEYTGKVIIGDHTGRVEISPALAELLARTILECVAELRGSELRERS